MEHMHSSESPTQSPPHAFLQLNFLESFLDKLSFTVDLENKVSSPKARSPKKNPRLSDLLSMIRPGFVSETKIRTDLQRAPYISYTSPVGKSCWSPSQLFKEKETGAISEDIYFGRYDGLIGSARDHSGPELASFLQRSFHQSGILDLAQTTLSWLLHKSLPTEGVFAQIDSSLSTPVYRYFTFNQDSIVLRDVLAYSNASLPLNLEEATQKSVAMNFFLESEVHITFDHSTNHIDIAIREMKLLFPTQNDMDTFRSLTNISFSERVIESVQAWFAFILNTERDLSSFHSMVQVSHSPLSEAFVESLSDLTAEKMDSLSMRDSPDNLNDWTEIDVARKNRPSSLV